MTVYVSSIASRKIRVRFGPITFVMMMALLALAASAHAASLTISKTLSEKQQAAASAYWTRERIAAAPALRLPIGIKLGRGEDPATLEEEAATEPVGSSAPSMADPESARIARSFYTRDWADLDEDLGQGSAADETAGTANIYTSYDVNTNIPLWKIYPHVWSGKLTLTTPTGGASCSATAISGNNIVTAAHCVYDSTANVFYSNWVFTPAFRNGGTPYGTFTARTCSILTAWANLSGNFSVSTWTRHDVAVCTMNKNSAGQTLNSAVGNAGRMWNLGNSQLVFINGYPAETYTGATIASGPTQYLRSCTAETFLFTTETLGSGCSWGRGLSGGSWLIGYKPFVISGWVESVTSGLILGQQNVYGARFNSNNIVILCGARGC